MTNEELWLTAQLVNSLGLTRVDIVPWRGKGDDILLSGDRNTNTKGNPVKLVGRGRNYNCCFWSDDKRRTLAHGTVGKLVRFDAGRYCPEAREGRRYFAKW